MSLPPFERPSAPGRRLRTQRCSFSRLSIFHWSPERGSPRMGVVADVSVPARGRRRTSAS
ncbi:hypothetical protein BD311DRAFT_763945 [Dichomitus squalens]|uniref:Uncharacterized protein n=1 Tax=Dichomitus squalens TaxID=114155 RepID=A0A4Q9MEC4_9APHY|nr:hypothetical protein BD311DRAFT_763945 [Dichomitus squalens]